MVAVPRLPAFVVGLGLLALGYSDARRMVLQTQPGDPENPEACDYEPGSTICSLPYVRVARDGTFYFVTQSTIGQVAPP
jgi:hypothetical protein